jgi:hypothetical protein
MCINSANKTKSPAQLAIPSTPAIPTEGDSNIKPYVDGNSPKKIKGEMAETLYLLDVVATPQTIYAVKFFISKLIVISLLSTPSKSIKQ